MFTKLYLIFNKFVINAVLSRFQIVEIYAFFPPNLYPKKVRVDNKITFSNSDLEGTDTQTDMQTEIANEVKIPDVI